VTLPRRRDADSPCTAADCKSIIAAMSHQDREHTESAMTHINLNAQGKRSSVSSCPCPQIATARSLNSMAASWRRVTPVKNGASGDRDHDGPGPRRRTRVVAP